MKQTELDSGEMKPAAVFHPCHVLPKRLAVPETAAAALHDMQEFSSPVERQSLNHWTTREVLTFLLKKALPLTKSFPDGSDGNGKIPGEGNGNTLQYSCLENSMDGASW